MVLPFALLVCVVADSPDDIGVPPAFEIGVSMACSTDEDCAMFSSSPHCNVEAMECQACLVDDHCEEGWACGYMGKCHDACSTDADCEGVGGLDTCDVDAQRCIGCLDSEGCEASEYCFEGYCFDDVCAEGQLVCHRDNVAQCPNDGSAPDVVETCAEGCVESGGGATCVGSTTGGTTPGSDGDATGDNPPPAESDGTSAGASPVATGEMDDGGGVTDRGSCACRSRGSDPAGLLPAGLLMLLGLQRRRYSATSIETTTRL